MRCLRRNRQQSIEFCKYRAEDYLGNAEKYAHDLMGNLNEGMETFLDWNLVLDEVGGPNHVNNYCDAPYLFHTGEKQLMKREIQHYLEHFAHYLAPGSVRIGFSRYTDAIEMTAFKSGDTIVVVLLNRTENALPPLPPDSGPVRPHNHRAPQHRNRRNYGLGS